MHASHAEQLACSPLRQRYREIRDTSLQLTKPFSAEDLIRQPREVAPGTHHLVF